MPQTSSLPIQGAFAQPATTATTDTPANTDTTPTPTSDIQSVHVPVTRHTLRYPFYTIEDILTQPDPSWLVDGMLLQNTTSLLYGAPKSGKSFLTLDLALSIATGLPFLGHEVVQGPVLYIAAEAAGTIKKRLLAWTTYHAVDTTGGLPCFRLVPRAVPLMQVDAVAAFTTDVAALVAALADDVQGQAATLPAPPVLVILDTLAKSTVGAEGNSNKEMDLALRSVEVIREAFRCHCLVVHHTGKGDETPRGASCLVGTPDTLLLVQRPDHHGSRIILTCAEQRDMKPFPPIALDLKQIQVRAQAPDATSCVLEVSEEMVRPSGTTPTPSKSTSKPDLNALQRLQVLQALEGFGAAGARYSEWHAATPDTISTGTFDRCRTSLLEVGAVVRSRRRDGKKLVDVYLTREHAPSNALITDGVVLVA